MDLSLVICYWIDQREEIVIGDALIDARVF